MTSQRARLGLHQYKTYYSRPSRQFHVGVRRNRSTGIAIGARTGFPGFVSPPPTRGTKPPPRKIEVRNSPKPHHAVRRSRRIDNPHHHGLNACPVETPPASRNRLQRLLRQRNRIHINTPHGKFPGATQASPCTTRVRFVAESVTLAYSFRIGDSAAGTEVPPTRPHARNSPECYYVDCPYLLPGPSRENLRSLPATHRHTRRKCRYHWQIASH